jgi:hypothetical protein
MAYVQQSGSATTARVSKGKLTAKTESKELGKANNDRIALLVTNGGAKDAWLALGEAAVAEEGIYLKKEGGAWENVVYTGPIFAITKEGETNLSYSEV